jgi:hypothetical protein
MSRCDVYGVWYVVCCDLDLQICLWPVVGCGLWVVRCGLLGLWQKTNRRWKTASVFALRARPRQVAKMRDDRTF